MKERAKKGSGAAEAVTAAATVWRELWPRRESVKEAPAPPTTAGNCYQYFFPVFLLLLMLLLLLLTLSLLTLALWVTCDMWHAAQFQFSFGSERSSTSFVAKSSFVASVAPREVERRLRKHYQTRLCAPSVCVCVSVCVRREKVKCNVIKSKASICLFYLLKVRVECKKMRRKSVTNAVTKCVAYFRALLKNQWKRKWKHTHRGSSTHNTRTAHTNTYTQLQLLTHTHRQAEAVTKCERERDTASKTFFWRH